MLSDPLDASPQQAAEILGDIARLRRRTRRALGLPWFPLVCFGGLTMLSAPVVAVAGVSALAPLWLVAGAAGMLATRRHYRNHARQLGLAGRGRRTWTVAVAISVLGMTAGVVGGTAGGAAGGVLAPIAVVVAGYLVLGWLQGNVLPGLAVALAAMVAVVVVLAGRPPWVTELTFGAALVVAGAAARAVTARS